MKSLMSVNVFQGKKLSENYDSTVKKLEECRELLKTNENGKCIDECYSGVFPNWRLFQINRKTRPFITERLLMGHKESNQTNIQKVLGKKIFTILRY